MVATVVDSIDKWGLKESEKVPGQGNGEGMNLSTPEVGEERCRGLNEAGGQDRVIAQEDGMGDMMSTAREPEINEHIIPVKVGKKWKKVTRHKVKEGGSNICISGQKRGEREGMINGLEVTEIEERRYLKQVGLNSTELTINESCISEDGVAGPTD